MNAVVWTTRLIMQRYEEAAHLGCELTHPHLWLSISCVDEKHNVWTIKQTKETETYSSSCLLRQIGDLFAYIGRDWFFWKKILYHFWSLIRRACSRCIWLAYLLFCFAVWFSKMPCVYLFLQLVWIVVLPESIKQDWTWSYCMRTFTTKKLPVSNKN